MEIAAGLKMEAVPQRIKKLREEFHLSQDDLGKLVGKTRATIIRWESEGPGENTALVVLALSELYVLLKRAPHGEKTTPVD